MAPANAPAASRAVLESTPRCMAAKDNPKKVVPDSNMITGVASAAVPHPQYSNTNRPVKFNKIVTQPADSDRCHAPKQHIRHNTGLSMEW